jgi:hypothetical protein
MASRRIVLWALAASYLFVGGWAQFAPASFFTSFPAGQGWVAVDGPFNEHLLRDVGGLNLALCAVSAWAAVRMSRELVRLTAIATLAYGVPHLAYHALHLQPYGIVDAIGIVASLVPGVAAGAWLAWSPAPPDRSTADGPGGHGDSGRRGRGRTPAGQTMTR